MRRVPMGIANLLWNEIISADAMAKWGIFTLENYWIGL